TPMTGSIYMGNNDLWDVDAMWGTHIDLGANTAGASGIAFSKDDAFSPSGGKAYIRRRTGGHIGVRSSNVDNGGYFALFNTEALTGQKTYNFPDKSGTFALTDDLDFTSLPGFGLSWNSTTNKIDWGTELASGIHGVIVPDGEALYM